MLYELKNYFLKIYETLCSHVKAMKTCVSASNDLCGKLVSSLELPITFDEKFKVTWAPFFIPNFGLLSFELDNFTFKRLYWVVLYLYYIKTK